MEDENRETEVTCLIPDTLKPGPFEVTVFNNDGLFDTHCCYTVSPMPPPVITEVMPNQGTIAGNALVRIKGEDFVEETTVRFQDQLASNIIFISDTELTCRTPSHGAESLVDVTVTNPNASRFTPPRLTSGFHV